MNLAIHIIIEKTHLVLWHNKATAVLDHDWLQYIQESADVQCVQPRADFDHSDRRIERRGTNLGCERFHLGILQVQLRALARNGC